MYFVQNIDGVFEFVLQFRIIYDFHTTYAICDLITTIFTIYFAFYIIIFVCNEL